MRELAVQSASDTNTTDDRGALQKEVDALIAEIDDISDTTEFNKMKLLDGTFNAKVIQSGANENQTMSISIKGVSSSGDLAVSSLKTSGISSQGAAAAAIKTVDNALQKVSDFRADLGAYQNRLEYKIQNLDNAAENMAAAESRIRDADMAKMMTEFTKNNILFQASTAMLAQANALPQGVLQLLG